MRNFHTECLSYQRLVKYGIMRAVYLRRKFITVAGNDIAVISCHFAYRLGEIVPGAHPFVGEMIDSLKVGASCLDQVHDERREVGCAGWRACLVKYDLDLFLFGCKTHHGLDKILSVDGIEPGRAQYDMTAPGIQDCTFSGKFGKAVHA